MLRWGVVEFVIVYALVFIVYCYVVGLVCCKGFAIVVLLIILQWTGLV